jgi:cyanophycinase
LTATGVWFSGGDQSRLHDRYVGKLPQRTRFQKALRDVLARGGVVGGTSAGMAALPEVMTLSQDRRRTDGPLHAVAAQGLGVLDGAIVEQHFDGRNGRMERFIGLLRDTDRLDRLSGRRGAGERMMGLAVEESTALVVQGARMEVLGAGEVHVFLKGSDGRTLFWHALRTGDQAALQSEGEDNRLVVGPK